jgi:hypothetical protein
MSLGFIWESKTQTDRLITHLPKRHQKEKQIRT